MTPSPANNDGRRLNHTEKLGRETKTQPDQTQLETYGNQHSKTPRVEPPRPKDEFSLTDSAELSEEEAVKAEAALAFLNEVREQTKQRQSRDHLPASIGGYSILRSLGRGGFAEVFLAEDKKLDRRVALKIPLFNSAMNEAGRQRFEREAKLAASLGHPQIVPVYEYGNVGPVRFIAFAWCDGCTLEQWIVENGPVDSKTAGKIIERLARAVEHAHQRGVVHRDLKPGNVLVDSSDGSEGKPVWERLRITDFGLARNYNNLDVTLTQDGQLVGTPAYMAPEQAGSGDEIGTAADIWALGMMLFELLTGKLPFRKSDMLATIRAICDQPVPKAKNQRRDAPGDVDAITSLCLRKNPAERYPSAHELAEDLQRFSNGEPVTAKPPSALSTFLMWTRRNPAVAFATSLAFLFLALGLAGTTWQYLRAAESLQLVERSLEKEQAARIRAERTADLFAKTYRRSKPGLDGRNLKVVDMLELTAQEINGELDDDQELKWDLLYQLALTYDGLGLYKPAVELLQEVHAEQIAGDRRESKVTLRTVIALQRSLHSMADYSQSSQKAAEALELATSLEVQGELLAKVLEAQGLVLGHDNKPREALLFCQQAIEAFESDENCELSDTLSARTLLATCQRMLGQFEEAATWMDEVVPEMVERYGNDRPEVITLLQEHGAVLLKLKKYDEAIELLQQQSAICEDVFGANHGRTLQLKGNLASTMTLMGRREEAIEIYREVVSASEKTHGESSPHTAVSSFLLAKQLIKIGQFEEAEPQLAQAFEVLNSSVGVANPWTERSHQALVWLWFRMNDWTSTIDHFVARAEAFEALAKETETDKNVLAKAAVSRIEVGQAMIRNDDVSGGLELIKENLELLRETDRTALVVRYHSSILAALIYRSEFKAAIPFAEEYLASTPLDYQHATDVFSSRVQAAAIELKFEVSFKAGGNILNEVDMTTASKLNTEQWLLLSESVEILKKGLNDQDSTCLPHEELICSLYDAMQDSVAIPEE